MMLTIVTDVAVITQLALDFYSNIGKECRGI